MLALYLTADLSGVSELRPQDQVDSPYYYTFKVVCSSCREPNPSYVGLNRFEEHDLSSSRGTANFVWRCKNCKRESSATLKGEPASYQITSPPQAQKIIEFDCRGCEFTDFRPDGDWACQGEESGTVFSGLDLQDGEWFDYDEKAGTEVSITDVKWEIRSAR